MKDSILKAFKIFLIITLIVLAILLVFGVFLSMDWPLWVGFFILLGGVGLFITFILLRKIWCKKREKQFVQQIIAQDESYLKGLSEKEKDHLKQLQDRWQEAVNALKQSCLRKHGNPLYVLPWYLVMGESGSGKTTAIKSARLSSPFAEISKISGISGTRNCDWWFFEQAIIIDTAGRYAIPIDEGRDKEEWQKFINLLAKYRKKEPLNGLIVTIAANKLLEAGTETLAEDGRTIRRRINELIRVLGAKPPIYILVTKGDLIQGMTQFCDHLPDKSLNQAMGFINQAPSTNAGGFLQRSLQVMVNRLRDFRLLLLHKTESAAPDPALLLFPEEMENIKHGLESFIKEAFQENPYQETQLLRGVFFSSGRQEGSPYSHFLKALGLIEEKQVLAGTNKGLFLHDLFTRIIPKDRNLFAPTQLAIEWKKLTKNLGLTAWLAIGIALCGLLSFSFVKNMRTLRGFSHEFSKSPELKREILTDITIMDRFREATLKMENRNRNWWIPRFGLHESKDIEMKIKEKYFTLFQKGILGPLDTQMEKRMTNFSKYTPKDEIGQYISHLVRRINLLKAHLDEHDPDALRQKPQPDYGPLIIINDEKIMSRINTKFGTLYLYYLIWRLDSRGIKDEEVDFLQSWLKHILTLKGMDLHWLVTWVNNRDASLSVSLEDFWEGSVLVEQKISVPPAFTAKGKKMIDSFMEELESALPDLDLTIMAKQKLDFSAWYQKAYYDTWYEFGAHFKKGLESLKDKEEWHQAASKIPSDEGPYFLLLHRMASEMEAFIEEKNLPSWINLLYKFQIIRDLAVEESGLKEGGFVEKAASKGKRLFRKSTSRTESNQLNLDIKAAKAFLTYKNALLEIVPLSASKNLSYQTASQVFNEDPASSQSPLYIADKAVKELKSTVESAGEDQKMLWSLITGPLDYLWSLIRMETACWLQQKWDETVLSEIRGNSGTADVYRLLDQGGEVWKFVNGPAAPFITWGRRKKYHTKNVLGGRIPFHKTLFSFLVHGRKARHETGRSYNVLIEGKPTSANAGAELPEAVFLELKCIDDTQRLENYNSYCKQTFTWSLQTCEDIILQIKIGNTRLIKQYKGYHAFPKFLNDFKGGKRTFFRKEFPKHKSTLEQLGIKYIDVEYRFTGHKPVLDLLHLPRQVPKDIVTCWDY